MSKIVGGELEARAQGVEGLEHLEALLRLYGELLVRRRREQGVGAGLGAPDAAAQLVELGEAEHVGPVHDEGVGGGDVEAGFDDGGGEQHVELALVERGHHVLELPRRHLAMSDRHLGLGHLGIEEALHLRQILDPRHHIEGLAAAIALAQQGLADHQRIERDHEGAHREAVHRWRRDDREFAHPGHGELERARGSGSPRGSARGHRPGAP